MEIVKVLRGQWERSLAVLAVVAGVVVMIAGYIGISGTPHVAYQMPYLISCGVVGIFLLGVAAISWLSADLRDEWCELHALRGLLEEDMSDRGVRRGSGAGAQQ